LLYKSLAGVDVATFLPRRSMTRNSAGSFQIQLETRRIFFFWKQQKTKILWRNIRKKIAPFFIL
jgi:hypothetical protein